MCNFQPASPAPDDKPRPRKWRNGTQIEVMYCYVKMRRRIATSERAEDFWKRQERRLLEENHRRNVII